MTEQFPLSQGARTALSMLEKAGYECYAVGGCVRDFLMGITPHDFDITTSSAPDETKAVFSAFRVIPTGEKHGTVTVMMDGEPLEITTFRRDGDYLDGRHPEQVLFTSAIEEDLQRRDFTVNAMAYSPLRGLCDPFRGRQDLDAKCLRCVGDAKTRFGEDALRLLRALRFAARLGFEIEADTAHALHEMAPAIGKVSRERVLSEMNGLLLADGVQDVMTQFWDVVCAAVPQLKALTHAETAQALQAVNTLPRDLALRWSALLYPLGREQAELTLRQLKASNQLSGEAALLISCLPMLEDKQNIKPLMRLCGPEKAEKCCLLLAALDASFAPAPRIKEIRRVASDGECYTLSMLAVTGSDLKNAGLTGKAIGKALEHLLQQVTEGKLPNEKQALLRAAGGF